MKLLIDLSHIAHANWNFAASKSINLWIHSMLSSIISYIEMFSPDEVIIATDKPSWREKIFPFYKIRKRKNEKSSNVEPFSVEDKQFFRTELNSFINELQTYFPLTTLTVENCEADDIIGALSTYFTEDVIIISKDKDFNQLLQYPHIKIFNPRDKEFVICDDPKKYIYSQILRGDATDDVPNFLSDDDTFDNSEKKQIPLRSSLIEILYEKNFILYRDESGEFKYNIPQELIDFTKKRFNSENYVSNLCKNYERNKKLIDFNYIPRVVRFNIITTYKNYVHSSTKETLETFLYKKELVQILSKINLFFKET